MKFGPEINEVYTCKLSAVIPTAETKAQIRSWHTIAYAKSVLPFETPVAPVLASVILATYVKF